MSDEPTRPARPLIGFVTGGTAPPIVPAPTNRGWMSATRLGWANRCLPLLVANQSGWELCTPRVHHDVDGRKRTRGSHADGEPGPGDHRTRRDLRPFVYANPPQ